MAQVAPPLGTQPLDAHLLSQQNQVYLGRDNHNQVHLDHPAVSRRHAEIIRHGDQLFIRDLGSANGTFVNGQPVLRPTPLYFGDLIQIGPFKLVYDEQSQSLQGSLSQGHRLDAIDLGWQADSGAIILKKISLVVQSGEFIALVGGSGAGKSSLMKAMNGYRQANKGDMLIDGEPLYENMAAYRTIMGYVPQDDIIHTDLPVYKALWYAARLRLPDATEREIKKRIKAVLKRVDMSAHAGKVVKVLSGGQRKRVSIAVELLADPDLFFLDEPTSGLDPGLEKKMMADLKELAGQGKTVILVTHATSNIEACDHVAFLVNGQLAYYGPPHEAIHFFQVKDFADIYLALAEKINPAQGQPVPPVLQPYYHLLRRDGLPADKTIPAGPLWAEHYRRSQLRQQYVVQPQAYLQTSNPQASSKDKRPFSRNDSILRQIPILVRRHLDLIRHNRITLFILLFMMPLIGALFMLVSNQTDLTGMINQFNGQPLNTSQIDSILTNRLADALVGIQEKYIPAPTAQQLITMLGLALTQAGTFGAARELVKERPIFRREKAVNLRVGAYVWAKIIVLAFFALIQVASVLLILSFRVDFTFPPIFDFFPNGGWELFATLLLAVLASIAFGLFISAAVPSDNVVLYVILGQLFAQIILSGAMFPLGDGPAADFASKAVISHWTMRAMGSTVGVYELDERSRVCTVITHPQTGNRDIQCDNAAIGADRLDLNYERNETHLLTTWAALFGHLLFWLFLTILVQARRKDE